MIKVDGLSFSHPNKILFENISFTVEPGRHCALIGSSGSGKSTLLDLLTDPERFTYDGKLQVEAMVRIGHVPQFAASREGLAQTVFTFMGADFLRLEEEMASLCAAMAIAGQNTSAGGEASGDHHASAGHHTSADHRASAGHHASAEPACTATSELDRLLEQYQAVMDTLDAMGGDDFESRIERQLGLAGLLSHRDRPVSSLSGGEFKLVQVMKEMLAQPDLLIMDEPDAYLDFENLEALKQLMRAHKGALLVITHNRYLLTHCFDKMLHLENHALQEFDGGYVDYLHAMLLAKIGQQELQLADDAEIARNEVLIGRLRETATFNDERANGKALKARVKVQERLTARRIQAPFLAIRQPGIHLRWEGEREDADVLRVQDFEAAYDAPLLERVSFSLRHGEKVALIGANGTGKTTLLRQIHGNRHPSIIMDAETNVCYLSQSQGEMLHEANTLLDEFLGRDLPTIGAVAAHLAPFGFAEETLEQKIGTMSGGEKTLLQLAKISRQNTGLVLLDEPTSHLDTYAQIALEEAIRQYKGAMLMVSHDFHTIANCMDAVLLLEGKTVRKMSMRKFRQKVYANHYDKDYLALEQKKKAVETRIELALTATDIPTAKALADELTVLVDQLKAMYK